MVNKATVLIKIEESGEQQQRMTCRDDIDSINATYDLFNFALLCNDIMCVFCW